MSDPRRLLDDPRRLLDETSDPFARALLASVESEEGPNPGARRRALAALGVGAALATGAAASTAAKAASAVGTASTAAAVGSVGSSGAALTPGGLLALKWLGIVVLGGTAVMTAAHFAGGHASVPVGGAPESAGVSAPAVIGTGPESSPTRLAPPDSSPNPDDVERAAPADSVPVDPRAIDPAAPPPKERESLGPPGGRPSSPAGASKASSPQPHAATLQEQTEMLDSVRVSLAHGDPSRALSELDSLNRRAAKNGLLGEEAAVLRIEALFASGNRRRGEELGNRFLAEHPASAYAQRVRSRLSSIEGSVIKVDRSGH